MPYISHTFELLNIVFFNYLLIVVYRPPSMSFNDTIKLCDIISSVSDSTKTSIIYGDFNLPGINWINGLGISSVEKYFYSFTQKNGLLQLVNFNTRNSNILDLILTNDIKMVSSIISTNPIEYDSHCSDHISILSCLVYPSGINRPIYSSPILPIQNYLKSDYYNIKNDLLSINWNNLLNSSINGSDMLTIFINKLLFICNKHTPLPKITKYRYPIHIKNY